MKRFTIVTTIMVLTALLAAGCRSKQTTPTTVPTIAPTTQATTQATTPTTRPTTQPTQSSSEATTDTGMPGNESVGSTGTQEESGAAENARRILPRGY